MQRCSVRTSDTLSKSLLSLPFRQGDERNVREFISEETRALLISPIRFDNELQKCYNVDVLNDVVHRRIAKKARYAKLRRVNPGAF